MLTPIEFGIVIPARNEARRIERSLKSVQLAVRASGAKCRIVVVDDRSTDQTVAMARRWLADAPGNTTISPGPVNVGNARALGAQHLMKHASTRPKWLVSTDADSRVPEDWLLRLAAHDSTGVDAVAGTVAIRTRSSLMAAFDSHYRKGIDADGHPHVHGANLAVRSSVYESVGGFRSLACGEDRDLWTRIIGEGFGTVSDPNWVVETSSRLRSRTRGGFASDLRLLQRATGEGSAGLN